jgi:hypothetical protein
MEQARMSERAIQREIVDFLKAIGCAVYQTSQGYRKEPGGTRMTPGIPDLYVVGPRAKHQMAWERAPWTWAEVKTEKGKLTPAQEEFRELCETSDIPHRVWRDAGDAFEWAVEVGLVEVAE